MNQQSIPCPTCNAGIPFQVELLLQGHQFNCPNCQASIGIASESKEIVSKSIEKFNEMKKGALTEAKSKKNKF